MLVGSLVIRRQSCLFVGTKSQLICRFSGVMPIMIQKEESLGYLGINYFTYIIAMFIHKTKKSTSKHFLLLYVY